MPGSRMFIDTRMKVPVEDLLKGLLVQSGNDAALALAEGVAGAVLFAVGFIATFFSSVGSDCFGMVLFPDIGKKVSIIRRAQ